MQDFSKYSPGLGKLIHNPEHLVKIKRKIATAPLHVSFFPNNQCQLSCKYCCFKKTVRDSTQLSLIDFKKAIDIAPSIKPSRYTYIHVEENRIIAKKIIDEDEILNSILI